MNDKSQVKSGEDPNDWRTKRNRIINKSPVIQSLLYDLDLLPEQVKEGSIDEWKLDRVVLHMSDVPSITPYPPTKNTPDE